MTLILHIVNNGRTALHNAAYFDYCYTITILFEDGARTNIHDNADRPPLGVAKDRSNSDAEALLTKYSSEETNRDISLGRLNHTNTSINNNEGEFLQAANLGMTEVVQAYTESSIIDPTINLNLVDLDRHSALHYAVQGDHLDIVQILIKARVDINILDGLQRTPVHWCALHYNYSAAEALLEARADPALKDHFDETARSIAPILDSL